eukprot:4864566-Amphidinium_carterae.1
MQESPCYKPNPTFPSLWTWNQVPQPHLKSSQTILQEALASSQNDILWWCCWLWIKHVGFMSARWAGSWANEVPCTLPTRLEMSSDLCIVCVRERWSTLEVPGWHGAWHHPLMQQEAQESG